MRIALNPRKERVHISQIKEGETYFCPICQEKVYPKGGTLISPYFSHYPHHACKDEFHDEEMSLWHTKWQDCFPIDCQEVVKEKNGVYHRADVLLEKEKTAIEFQHSSLSPLEFQKRNQFYLSLGYRVIWLFDLQEAFQKETIQNVQGDLDKYHFASYGFRTLKDTKLSDDLNLFFQKSEKELLHVTWISPKGIRYFYGKPFTKENFLDFCYRKEIPLSFPKYSIPYYWEKDYAYMIVENTETFQRALISKDPSLQLEKYHAVYGREDDSFGNFTKESSRIEQADQPLWRRISYRKKKSAGNKYKTDKEVA